MKLNSLLQKICNFIIVTTAVKLHKCSKEFTNKIDQNIASENKIDFIGDILELRQYFNKKMVDFDSIIIDKMYELIEYTEGKNIFDVHTKINNLSKDFYLKRLADSYKKIYTPNINNSKIVEITNKLILFEKIHFEFSENRHNLSLNVLNTKREILDKLKNNFSTSVDDIFGIFQHILKHKKIFLKNSNSDNIKQHIKEIICDFRSSFLMMEESSNLFHWLIDYAENIQLKEEISIKYPFNQNSYTPLRNINEPSVGITEYYNFLKDYQFSERLNAILNYIRTCYINISKLNYMFFEYSDHESTSGCQIDLQTENLMNDIFGMLDFEDPDGLKYQLKVFKNEILEPFSLYIKNFIPNLELLQDSLHKEKSISNILSKDSLFYRNTFSKLFVDFKEPFHSFKEFKKKLSYLVENINHLDSNDSEVYISGFFEDVISKITTIRQILYNFQHSSLDFVYNLCALIESKKPDNFIIFYSRKVTFDKMYVEKYINFLNNNLLLSEKFASNISHIVQFETSIKSKLTLSSSFLSSFLQAQRGILKAIEFNMKEYCYFFRFSEYNEFHNIYIHRAGIEQIKKYLNLGLESVKNIKNCKEVINILEHNNVLKSYLYRIECTINEITKLMSDFTNIFKIKSLI